MSSTRGKTLPETVVEQDHKLEKTQENAGRKLCQHRWHWTLDESNPDQVSFSEYGRAVGRTHTTIRSYAHGYVLLKDNPSMTVTEAMKRVGTSVDTEVATDAVAAARNVQFHTVTQDKHYRDEAKAVQQQAKQRSQKNGTSIKAEATKAARQIVRESQEQNRDKVAAMLDKAGTYIGDTMTHLIRKSKNGGCTEDEISYYRWRNNQNRLQCDAIDLALDSEEDPDNNNLDEWLEKGEKLMQAKLQPRKSSK
jgi:hypothetical protein